MNFQNSETMQCIGVSNKTVAVSFPEKKGSLFQSKELTGPSEARQEHTKKSPKMFNFTYHQRDAN